MSLPRGTFWPSCTVARFERVDATTVAVHVTVRRGWLRRKQALVWRLQRSSAGNWYWLDTGVELSHAQSFVWAGLEHAIGAC